MKKKPATKSNARRARAGAVKDLEPKAEPKGGKMHLEDISLGFQGPTGLKVQDATDMARK